MKELNTPPMSEGELYVVKQLQEDETVKEIISVLKKKEGLTYAEAHGILRNASLILKYEATYLSELPI